MGHNATRYCRECKKDTHVYIEVAHDDTLEMKCLMCKTVVSLPRFRY